MKLSGIIEVKSYEALNEALSTAVYVLGLFDLSMEIEGSPVPLGDNYSEFAPK